jgi:transcriptional regulator with XRE-family HTH domain
MSKPEPIDLKGFSRRLLYRRKELNLTQEDVAKKMINLPIEVYADWERGLQIPDNVLNFMMLCRVLSCQPEWLRYGKSAQQRSDKPKTIDSFIAGKPLSYYKEQVEAGTFTVELNRCEAAVVLKANDRGFHDLNAEEEQNLHAVIFALKTAIHK